MYRDFGLGSSIQKLIMRLQNFEKMKHLAAYLLLGLGGNTSPSASDIKSVLEAVGIDADNERLEKLISELKGKDLSEVGYQVITLSYIYTSSHMDS